jgi:hypothetical protein
MWLWAKAIAYCSLCTEIIGMRVESRVTWQGRERNDALEPTLEPVWLGFGSGFSMKKAKLRQTLYIF